MPTVSSAKKENTTASTTEPT
uniref:Uncharacterized protein n=1 Tax=Anguilla anguilla TaxID=7936 RepID=A0A0E9XLW1_ANGAN